MKKTISLQTMIIYFAIFLVTLTLVSSGFALFKTWKSTELTLKADLIGDINRNILEAKYHVTKVQEAITDASLTRNEKSLIEANNDLKEAFEHFDNIIKLDPSYKGNVENLRELAKSLYDVGNEMAYAYKEKGADAGDKVMSRPFTGLDAISNQLETKIDILSVKLKKLDDEYSAKSSSNLTLVYKLNIAVMVIECLTLLFSFIYIIIRIRPLNSIISELSQRAESIASASRQVASASSDLAQASTEQASALEETASSLEEITAMIAKSSDSAEDAAKSSFDSHHKADAGKKAVNEMMNSINEISQSNDTILNQVNESNRQMAEFVQVIQDIATKTKVINDIVFQTKLLSFNASVEAARAGEQGKGFAVVAEEVGNLAQMSGNSASEITTMLDASIKKVEFLVKESQTKVETLVKIGKEKVDNGIQVAKDCQQVLEDIVQNVSRTSHLAQEISHSAKEQSSGVGEINRAISQLDSVTQQNSAISEEAASASGDLFSQSESMQTIVEELIKVVGTSVQAKIKIKRSLISAPMHATSTIPSPIQHIKKDNSDKRLLSQNLVCNSSVPDHNAREFEEA